MITYNCSSNFSSLVFPNFIFCQIATRVFMITLILLWNLYTHFSILITTKQSTLFYWKLVVFTSYMRSLNFSTSSKHCLSSTPLLIVYRAARSLIDSLLIISLVVWYWICWSMLFWFYGWDCCSLRAIKRKSCSLLMGCEEKAFCIS